MTKKEQRKGKRESNRRRKRVQLSVQLIKTMTPERLEKLRAYATAVNVIKAIKEIATGQPPAGR